jgi:hypothetical protein
MGKAEQCHTQPYCLLTCVDLQAPTAGHATVCHGFSVTVQDLVRVKLRHTPPSRVDHQALPITRPCDGDHHLLIIRV